MAFTTLWLTACGGGGGGGDTPAAAPSPLPAATGSPPPASVPSPPDAAPSASAPGPTASAEFMVNTTTAGSQRFSAMARLNDGGHVVVWLSDLTQPGFSSNRSICKQRYGVDGAAAGAETCVGSPDPTPTPGPAVAALSDGGYVVAWATEGDVRLTSSVIRTQRYDFSGSAVGVVQQANENAGLLNHVQATAVAGGGYVLSWTRSTQDAGLIALRRFGTDGLPAGPEQTMNTGFNYNPRIAALDGGGYVIVRSDSSRAVGRDLPILATRYDNKFAQVGPEITVSDIGGFEQDTRVINLAGGGFAIGWRDSVSGEVRVQRFASDGSRAGTPVPVDSPVPIVSCIGRVAPPGVPCPAFQGEVALAGLEDGGYVATWTADFTQIQTGSRTAKVVFARRFAANGSAAGPVVQVSSRSNLSGLVAPSIAALPSGSVAITWGVGGVTFQDIFERRLDARSLLGGTTP